MSTTCPVCGGALRVVSHATFGGRRLHAEVSVFDCARHGTVFLTREGLPGPGRGGAPDPRDDAPLPLPLKPPPGSRSGAIALREPDPGEQREPGEEVNRDNGRLMFSRSPC
jgi:hypothetical protein